MSVRYEQYGALKRTREFLRLLLTTERPKKVSEIRKLAYSCLRHYPFLRESGEPMWSRDPFTKDEEPCSCKGGKDDGTTSD